MAENNQVGEKIRKVRKCLGFSQEEFAFRVGVTKQTVSLWELGSAQPGFDKINFICQEFNVDANTFIYPIDKKNSDRKVAATTITNDVIFLPTPVAAETKSEVKLPMSKEKKITIAFNACIWLLFVTIVAIFSICMYRSSLMSDFQMGVRIKVADTIIMLAICASINILLTAISTILYNIRGNKKHKEIKNDNKN